MKELEELMITIMIITIILIIIIYYILYYIITSLTSPRAKKNHFSAERKNARFSVIPARTGSVVLLGYFFDGPDDSPEFR